MAALVDKQGRVNGQAVYGFAEGVRALAGELRDRLSAEVSAVAESFDGKVAADPAAASLRAAMSRLDGEVGTVAAALARLDAAAASLATEALR